MNEFESLCQELEDLLEEWEPGLLDMPPEMILGKRNKQDHKADGWTYGRFSFQQYTPYCTSAIPGEPVTFSQL